MQEPDDVDPAIRRALVALAEDDAGSGASLGVEDRLREAVRSIARSRRRRVRLWGIGMAATVLLAATLTRWRGAPDERVLPAGAPTGIAALEVATEFFPLPYASVPSITAYTVRLELPRSALLTFGFGTADLFRALNAPETVYADVVVGEDGLARSVRFLLPRTAEKRP
jgi:hypothetical protein